MPWRLDPATRTTNRRAAWPALLLAVLGAVGSLAPLAAVAQHDRDRGERVERGERGERGDRGERGRPHGPGGEARWERPAPGVARDHGHVRPLPVLPAPGAVVRVLPPRSVPIVWTGTHFHHADGVWYRPVPHGWRVVHPPHGVVVRELPWWATTVVVGGVAYWLVNEVYYRERPDGYEVVPPPPNAPAPMLSPDLPRQFVYPRNGQSAQQQASDEYECHRWAVQQTGFDPTAGATGNPSAAGDPARRDDYLRARAACLDGRGYTVK